VVDFWAVFEHSIQPALRSVPAPLTCSAPSSITIRSTNNMLLAIPIQQKQKLRLVLFVLQPKVWNSLLITVKTSLHQFSRLFKGHLFSHALDARNSSSSLLLMTHRLPVISRLYSEITLQTTAVKRLSIHYGLIHSVNEWWQRRRTYLPNRGWGGVESDRGSGCDTDIAMYTVGQVDPLTNRQS